MPAIMNLDILEENNSIFKTWYKSMYFGRHDGCLGPNIDLI